MILLKFINNNNTTTLSETELIISKIKNILNYNGNGSVPKNGKNYLDKVI